MAIFASQIAKSNMELLYGRAPSNERIIDYVPDVRFERESVISGLSINGIQAPLMFLGTLNGNVFKSYISECLAPTLRAGNIVLILIRILKRV